MNNIAIPTMVTVSNAPIKRGVSLFKQAFPSPPPWLEIEYQKGNVKVADGWETDGIHLWITTNDNTVLVGPGDKIHYKQDGTLNVEINKREGKLTSPPAGLVMGETGHVWKKNGDHPDDYKREIEGLENGELRTFSPEHQQTMAWEGQVVRYFRHPDISGNDVCGECGHIMHFHGWIDQGRDGITVCPGDTVIAQGGEYAVLQGSTFVES